MSKLLSDDDVFGSASKQGGLLSDDDVFGTTAPKEEAKNRSTGDIIRDVGVTALKGAVGLPQAIVGIADIPAGGHVGKGLESIGYRPDEAQKMLDDLYSDQTKADKRYVQEADGFLDTIDRAVERPATIATAVGESIPSMIGGAGIARGVLKVAPKVAPVVAGAIGEGSIGAGQAAEQIRNESKDRLLSPVQQAAAVGSGVGTGLLGFAGGKLAQRMGIGDIDTILASGTGQATAKGFARQVIESGISEGVFEELPQSAQEQMWQNFATGKPIMDQVGNQAAMGMLAGAAMGGAGGGYNAALNAKDKPSDIPNGDGASNIPPSAPGEPAMAAADVLGTPEPSEAEKALYQPRKLTALDRVNEIDRLLSSGSVGVELGVPISVSWKSGKYDFSDTRTYDYKEDDKRLSRTSVDEDGTRRKDWLVETSDGSFIWKEAAGNKESYAALSRDDAQQWAQEDLPEGARVGSKDQQLQQERDSITATWPKSVRGAEASFSTEAGARVDSQYALMEADDLVTSHDANLRANPLYPQELQPRERDRAASEMQVSGIVQKLDPARLGESADAANGAPIVGEDGLVESGNARTIALKRVYQANGQKASDYKQFIADNAARFGITPESVQAMQKPVLVRVRTTPVDRAEFARQANASTVAQMSPSEQAKSDAARIDDMADLVPDDQGDFTNADSRGFIRRFMAKLPGTEQAGMIDSNGQLSQSGYARVRNAVLAKAYGDSPVLMRMVESMDDQLRNVTKALMRVAPQVAKARQAIGEGALHDADITPDLMAAVSEMARLKDEGRSIKDALAQQSMFGGYSQETKDLLAFLDENVRRPRVIAEFILNYFEALNAAGNPNQGSLLGDNAAPAKGELLSAAQRMNDGQQGQSGRSESAVQEGRGQQENAASREGSAQGNDAGNQKSEWVVFPKQTGTLGIPRSEMPQIKGDHRGALIAYLKGKGIDYVTEDIPAADLKPTQAEFSTKKAEKWGEVRDGVDRSVLASNDGYILDGHHQWVAALAQRGDVKAIHFDAPIKDLLAEVYQFPSTQRGEGASTDESRRQAREDFDSALSDLGAILRDYAGVARMIPENTPRLMPTLVKLFEAGIREVGYNVKDLVSHVKKSAKAHADTKAIWNKINDEIYRKAARQAVDNVFANPQAYMPAVQGDLFASPEQPAKGVQLDLFGAMAQAAPTVFKAEEKTVKKAETITVDGKEYDIDAPNFGMPKPPITLKADDPLLIETHKKDANSTVVFRGKTMTRIEMRQAIEDGYFDQATPAPESRKPIAYVMGGGGASGKGHVKDLMVSTGRISVDGAVSLDPDEVKPDIPEYEAIKAAGDSRAAAVTHEESSDIAKRIRTRAISGRYDILLDVTLGDSAKGKKNLQELKDAGYEVRLFGVTVDPAKAVVRAMNRAARTKRYVPINALLHAHKGFNGAFEEYAAIADEAILFDNTTESQEIAHAEGGKVVVSNQSAYNEVAERSQINERASTLREIANRAGSGLSGGSQSARPGVRSGELVQHPGVLEQRGTEAESGRVRREDGSRSESGVRERPASSLGQVNENGEPDQVGAEGQASDTLQGTGNDREIGRVRDDQGGRDQRGNRQSDDGTGQVAGDDGSNASPGENQAAQRRAKSGNRGSAGRNAGIPAGRDIPSKTGRNYAFVGNDLTYDGSWLVKARQNVEALELLKQLEKEGRQASREEQAILAKFIGWGASDLANSIFGDKLDKQLDAISKYDDAIAAFDRAGNDSLYRGGRVNGYFKQGDVGYYAAFNLLNAKAGGKLEYYSPDLETITRAQVEAAKPDSQAKKWAELRDRIKAAMTPEEWATASRSTQYAHYTSKSVVQSMMKALERMGFKGGTILEPGAGIGVFPGLMPVDMATNSAYTGIEFDHITGGILKQLFPDERILVESFIDTALPDNYYDIGFGNPPFGNIPILADPKYRKQGFALHDYFFAKTMDSVKPGGLVVFVTSRYTMDKLDDKARAYLADRADLVGAIRLPQTAFKKNAGTDVVTDVLFLRKKVEGETFDQAQAWGKSIPMKVGSKEFPVNEYYHAHPEMVLGDHSDTGKMANTSEPQYTVVAKAGDIEAQFDAAAASLPENVFVADAGTGAKAAQVRSFDWNPKAQKEGNYYIADDGKLMIREGGYGVSADLDSKQAPIVRDFVALRDALKTAHYDQLNDGDWEASLDKLRQGYQAFVEKHGRLHQFTTYMQRVKLDAVNEDGEPTGEKEWGTEERRRFPVLTALRDDPDWTLVAALESFNDETGEIKDGQFLSGRVLDKPKAAVAETPTDALLQTLNDTGNVDMGMIADRLGVTEREAIESLGTLIYDDPSAGWVTADEYLSGDVRKKLKQAEAAAKTDKRYQRNVEALISAMPAPRTHTEITPQIGMPWIPADMYEQFLGEKAQISTTVTFNERTGQWHVAIDDSSYKKSFADRRSKRKGDLSMAATQDWGTDRRNAADILEYALTGAPVRIMSKEDMGGGKTKEVFDQVATEAAIAKVNQMREAFKSWLWEDQTRIEKLVPVYNDKFNTMVPRKFDGTHMTLPGTSTLWSVFDHVKRGAWRIVQSGNTYLAHAVGSGKTFQMVISAMEQKRLGLIKKPMMVVPNHMLQQFAHEWQSLYPAARLMVADEQNFTGDNRRRFVARVAMSDLDGVIITQSAFKLLDLDPEFKAKMIEQELDFLRAAYQEVGGNLSDLTFEESTNKNGDVVVKLNGSKSRDPKIKQIENKIERMEQKLRASLSGEGKDKNVRFDEMGVDMLYVDEAHLYRKLSFVTQRQVKGVDPNGSDQAFDLWMKVQWLRENKNPNRNLVMASGTPVTNTMAELYTVQKFMAPDVLEERGLAEFDQWASMFGAESTAIEPDASGKYGPVTRFNKFVNVSELTQMFRDFADVLTSDYLASLLGDKRPKVKDGARQVQITPKTDDYATFQKEELQTRMERSRAWKPSKDEPNNPDPIIAIIGDGRLAAIDMRFMDPSLPNDPDSKLNKMIDEVIRVHKETADWEYKDKAGKVEPNKGAAQIVFSDLGFGAGVAASRGFNARAWFEKRLRDAGVKPDQIAFMSDYKKSSDKLKLFAAVNSGKVRIVVGSSKNMGTGVNAQQRLIALHHLDAPWYPADLEQREGRIIRQGNKNPIVQIYAYASKGSYDEQMWSTLARKQFFIDQALSGDPNIREIEDLGEASQFEIAAAMVADDPRVLQLAGLRAEVEKLSRLYQAHEDSIGRLRRDYAHAKAQQEWAERSLDRAEKLANKVQDLSGDNFTAKAGGKTYTVRKEWGQKLMADFKERFDFFKEGDEVIGQISGFDVVFVGTGGQNGKAYMAEVALRVGDDDMVLAQDPNTDPVGVALRAATMLAGVARAPGNYRQMIEDNRSKMVAVEPRLNAPFPLYQMLLDKEAEARDLEDAIVGTGQDDGLAREQAIEDAWAARTGAITPLFSRGNGSNGMALRDLQALVDRVSRGFKNLPKVHVMASPAALSTKDPAQKSLRDFIRKAGAWDDVEGATHEGEIYLFASGLADESRAEHVFATHEVTHYGLRGAIGKDLDIALQEVWTMNNKVRKAAAELRKRNGLKSNIDATEEVLADMPQGDLVKLIGWRRVVKSVRDWLKRAGLSSLAGRIDTWLKSGMDEQQKADLYVADLVNAARQWVRNGKGSPFMHGTRLADGSLAEDVAKQEKWLTSEAKARGYQSIDDLAERNYPLFEKLAKLWREKNPADALLSRVSKRTVAVTEETPVKIDGKWTVGEAPKVGDKFIVYRFGNATGDLAGRNAGNAWAVSNYIMSQEDYFKPSNGDMGTHVFAYEVEITKPFGKYEGITRGVGDRELVSGAPVGRVQNKGSVAYSFERDGAWKAKTLGSVSLDQLYAAIKQHTGGEYRNFDGTGTIMGAEIINNEFSAILSGSKGFDTPRFSRNINSQTANQRAEEIIQKSSATWRPVDAVMRTLSHAVRLDALTGALYNKAGELIDRLTPENVKAGVISDYGLPEAVVDQRVAMQGKMRVQLRKTGDLLEKLSTLTRAESRVAYEWMNNADPQAAAFFEDQLPPESLKVMEEVKGMIDRLSQEAVNLGQLDLETFKRNRFEYLRRSYIKHTAELTKSETEGRRRAIAILGDQYKGRGMTDAVDMAKFKNVAPEWWNRKLKDGQADKQLKGEKFIRLERREVAGAGVMDLEQAAGPGETNPQGKGKLREVIYWPEKEPIPAKYSTWDQAGTWEVRDTKGGKLIVWRDFTKQERVSMGEIDEARYAIAKTLHGMIHDVETGRYLEWLANTYSKQLASDVTGDLVEASERMRDTFNPGEWVQVPETKIPGTQVMKYGKLAGRYLPGPIWNDVRQTVGFRFKPLGETYAAIMGAWKTAKTALSPAVHTNNVMANFVMADWHDVSAGHIAKALRIILGASQRDGRGLIGRTVNGLSRAGMRDSEAAREIIARFHDSGANLGSWVTTELQKDQLEPLLEAMEKELGTLGETQAGQVGVMVALQKALQLRFPSAREAFKPTLPGKVIRTEAGSLIDLYEAEDQVFRLAAWLRAKEEGASDIAAGKVARRSFLDYHINAPWVQAMRSTAFPFISFTYRSVPMLLEVAAKKPHKILKLAMLAGALNALGYMLSGGDEDDERKLLPEEKAGSIWGMVPKLVRMPWNDEHGSPVFLDIRRFVPVGDIFDTGQNHAAIPLLPFALPGGPLSVMSELVANKSQFTGKAITKETDTGTEKAAKVADHLFKAFAPNIIILPGTYAFTGVMDANSGKTDSFGREQSVIQALGTGFGVKVGSYPKDQLALNAQRAAQAKVMEIDSNITQLKREYARKGISEAEFTRKVEEQTQKKIKVVNEFNAKFNSTRR